MWQKVEPLGDVDRHEVDDFGRCVLWSSQLARSSFMARWKVFRRSVPVPGYGAQSGFVRP